MGWDYATGGDVEDYVNIVKTLVTVPTSVNLVKAILDVREMKMK